MLKRDSAAMRHLVWLVAIVAMLFIPVLSVLLPQWQVLPAWAAISQSSPVIETPNRAVELPRSFEAPTAGSPESFVPGEFESQREAIDTSHNSEALEQPRLEAPQDYVGIDRATSDPSWSWISVLPFLWSIGFAVLILRLMAARWMLWRNEQRASLFAVLGDPHDVRNPVQHESDAAIVAAFENAHRQLGIRQRVQLLIDSERTIPVVWGIFCIRLMLPDSARQWSSEQLRSVLLHELAHIKRRDTIVQLLAQFACALHWFNPLVWFAAWRLHVERERACDDLVLAQGVRASAYAEHLLNVATKLSVSRWTSACGLAMASHSPLESRLHAILSDRLNRRKVSTAIGVIGLLLGAAIAIPIAMLRAAADDWNPPSGAHVGSNEFSAYCVHDGKNAAFVIAYQGFTGSSSAHDSNSKTRTWTDSGTITAKKPGIALSFHREHIAPDKLSITTAPSEARDLSKPAPPPREFGQKEYDLNKGRVFLLSDNGSVRQLDIATPIVTDQETLQQLAALIPATTEKGAFTAWGKEVGGLQAGLGFKAGEKRAYSHGETVDLVLRVRNVGKEMIKFSYFRDEFYENPPIATDDVGKSVHIEGAGLDGEPNRIELNLAPGKEVDLSEINLGLRPASEKGKQKPAWKLFGTGKFQLQCERVAGNFEDRVNGGPDPILSKLATGKLELEIKPAAAPAPMHKDAKALFEEWQRYARSNGDIPGALVGELAASVKQFIKYNPTWETVPKLNELLPRLDATRDWKPADAIALLDEVAGIQDSPLSPVPWKGTRDTIRQGDTLPEKYADVAWGEEQPNGLRAAWVLEPSAAEYRIDTALKARLLVQNRGQVPVMLQVPTFHQGWVTGTDAKGSEVQVSGISWTTRALLNTVRLEPGEHVEINTPGVGIGPRAGIGPWAGPRVGSNVLAKAGDELTLTHGLVPLDGSEVGVSEDDPYVSGPGWWLAHIKARLNRELPLPADATERTRLLDRAVRELFATAPTAEETEAFIADRTPDALDALAKRLAMRVDVVSFSGKLPTAPTKFRVLDADANADKQPRVVLGPGEYPLSGGTATSGAVTLKIIGRPVGDRRTNEAQILFEATEATGKLPPDSYKLEIPDGWGTWTIVCRSGEGFFYLLTKGAVRKIDYTNPREVADTPANDLPAEFRDEVKRQLDIAGVSAEAQVEIFEVPAPPAALLDSKTSASAPAKPTGAGAAKLVKLPDEDYTKTGVHCQKFLKEDAKRPDGRLMGRILDPKKLVDGPLVLGLRVANDANWRIGSETRVELVVRNQSQEDVKFAQTLQSDIGLSVVAIDEDGKEYPAKIAPSDSGLLVFNRLLLPKNGYVTMVKSFSIRFDAEERFDSGLNVAAFHLPPGDYTLRCQWNDALPDVAHEGEWTGELVNEELEFTLAEAVTPPPTSEAAKTKEEEPITAWGKEVGGLQAGFCITNANDIHIGGKVKAVVKLRNVSQETISASAVPLWVLMSPPMVVDSLGKPVRTTDGPYLLLDFDPTKLTLKPGEEVDFDKTEIPVAELNQEVKVATGKVTDRRIIHVEPGRHKVSWTASFVQEHGELATGTVEFEVKTATIRPEMKGTGADVKTVDTSMNADSKDEHSEAPASAKPNYKVTLTSTAQPDWVLAWDFRITPLDQQYSKMRISKDGKLETILRKPPLLRTQLSSAELSELIALVAKNPQAKSQPISKLAKYSKDVSPTPELFEALKKVQVRSEIIAVVHEGELFELDLNSAEAMVVDGQLKKFVGLAAIGGAEELYRLVELANRELMQKYPNLSTPIDPSDFYDGEVDQSSGKISVWFNYSIDPESTDGQMVLLRISENGQPSIEQVILPRIVKLDELEETGWKLPNAGANIVRVSDDQYMKSGVPVAEVKDVVWNDPQNGLSLGYRIMGDEWRILGRPVDVELWVRNSGDKDVKFQHEARRDIGLRMNMKGEKGAVHKASIVRNSDPPAADYLLLPPDHAFKVKEAVIVSLLWRGNDVTGINGHYFLTAPGAYEFQCELDLPGFSRIGEGGKQFTPAEDEWSGKLTTRGLKVEVIAPDAPAPKPRIESEQDVEQSIKTIPVTSKELSGIWYGATDRTGVVIRFIGRESRIKNTRGTVSGKWVVHVADGSVGSALEFTDDPNAGVVRITVGLWNDKAKEVFTMSLGSIERGEDDTLYLTINDNPKEPMYLQAKRIPLTFIDERAEIQRSDVEKMQSLMQTFQHKKPNNLPE
jgi:beta-lactamase regulating signal transducer with metallopeptidase domain